jgi:hypothetical protein
VENDTITSSLAVGDQDSEDAMIKMQIIMDDEKIAREKRYSAKKMVASIDAYLVGKLGMRKAANGFYFGTDPKKDFSYFGLAFNTLRKKDWFVDNVKTWLYFNSDASDDPGDFVIENCRQYCLEQSKARS